MTRSKGSAPGDTPTKGFWILSTMGWAIIGYGVWGVFNDSERTNPATWAAVFFGGALVHDLLLAPLVFVLGSVVVRLVPVSARPAIQAGLIASGLIALVAFPFVAGFGRRPDDPSALPNDYGAGLAILLGFVWIIAAATAWYSTRNDRPRKDSRKAFR